MSSTNMKNNKFYFVSTLFIYTIFALIKRNYFKTGKLNQRRLRGGRVLQGWIQDGRSGFCWEKLDERNGLEDLGPEGKVIFKRISKLEKDRMT